MIYYKNINFREAHEAAKGSCSEWNRYAEKHLYATCSACQKEYQYFDSPVLYDHIWNKVVKFHNLENLNDVTSAPLQAKVVSTSIENRLIRLAKVVPDNKHCTICLPCMEKALRRKLTREDLVNCNMNNHIIEKFSI